jgi:drug/metabolite transporter (DMT)-like permease
MSLVAGLFGVVAAVCWGLSPVLSKRGFAAGGTPALAALILVSIGIGGLWTATLVVYSPPRIAAGLRIGSLLTFLSGGLVGTAIGRVLNYRGIDRLGASVNSAIVAADPVFAAGIAAAALGEPLGSIQFVGVVAAVAGLAMVSLSGGGNRRDWSRRDLLFPLAAAVAYGAGAVIRRFGLQTTPTPPLQAAALNETAAFVGIGAYIYTRTGVGTRGDAALGGYRYLIAAGLVNTVGLVALFVALENGPVVIGSTLAGLSTLVTILGSAVALRRLERVTRYTIFGAVTTVVGASLVVVG